MGKSGINVCIRGYNPLSRPRGDFFMLLYHRVSLGLIYNYGFRVTATRAKPGYHLKTTETRCMPLIYRGRRHTFASWILLLMVDWSVWQESASTEKCFCTLRWGKMEVGRERTQSTGRKLPTGRANNDENKRGCLRSADGEVPSRMVCTDLEIPPKKKIKTISRDCTTF